MPVPQYNVQLIDGMPTGYYNRSATMLQPKPIVNPIKKWWNSVVNNARQNAFNQVNNRETVAPNVPAYNPLYSITNSFGVPAYWRTRPAQQFWYNTQSTAEPQMPTVYGTNTRRGSNTGLSAREMMLMQIYGTPAGEDYDQYDIGGPQQKYLHGVESLESLIARGAVDPYGHDPYEVGGSPYEYYPAVITPELPPYQPGGGGYVGGGGGGGGYTAMPSSPGYTGYGGGYNPSGAPRAVYSQGRGSGYVSGYGGYAGGQSQRSAWYGALLQWNI